MRQGPAKPVLRLVHADEVGGGRVLRASNAASGESHRAAVSRRAERIEQENLAAAGMSALDARWVFAVEVAKEISLSGAPAAGVLAPERRRNLVRLATRLGLRPFDANLVIAIVQDDCRSGEPGRHGRGLSRGIDARLVMVRDAQPDGAIGLREMAAWLLAGACLSLTIGLALARWISS